MAIIRAEEARALQPQELGQKISELEKEYFSELGKVAGGGRPENPGRVRELRRTIARLLTIIKEAGSRKRKANGKRAQRIAAAKEKPEKKKKEKKAGEQAVEKEAEEKAGVAKKEKTGDKKVEIEEKEIEGKKIEGNKT